MSEPATGRPPLPPHILAAQNADVLRCIGAQDAPQTAAQIAAATGKDKSNTRKTLERLVEAGLLQKDWAGLTAEGRAMLPRLDALEGAAPSATKPGAICWAQIQPSANNPRTDFDDLEVQDGIRALADSIEARGLKQPIRLKPTTVTDEGVQFYEIIDGERRWRAIGLLVERESWPADREVDTVIDHYITSEADQLLDAMVANLQRADLNPIDEARGYHTLTVAGRRSTEDIAHHVGRSRRHIQQRLQLLKLDAEAQGQVRTGEIGVKDALARVQEKQPAPETDPQQSPSGEEGAPGADNARAPSEPDYASMPLAECLRLAGDEFVRLTRENATGNGGRDAQPSDLLGLIELADYIIQDGEVLDDDHWFGRAPMVEGAAVSPQWFPAGRWGGLSSGGGEPARIHMARRAIELLRKFSISPEDARQFILHGARATIGGADGQEALRPTPYLSAWLRPLTPTLNSEAVQDEGPQRDFVHTGAAQASAARQAGFSAGGALEQKTLVSPAAFADAITPAQRGLLAEIAWVWRHAGRMVSLPDGRMGRAIPAAGADSHPATLNLIHGARLPAKALAHWYAPGEGPLLTFTEPGRQALRHFAAALGNLDASDEAALDDLQAVRRLAGATADVCDLMAARNQVAAPWLNAVLQEAPATSPRREAEIDATDVADAEEAAHADAAAWAARAMAERDAELAQPSYSYTASEVRQMLAEAFFRGRRGVERELMENTQACRVCACTEDDACQPPCAWVESEIVALCTTCAPYAAKAASQPEQEPA